jgi:type II secretory ATPase GspE/PulE/Tfp pilus assembly ATPase PilB-like protein
VDGIAHPHALSLALAQQQQAPPMLLGQALLAIGAIGAEQLEEALRRQAAGLAQPLGQVLLAQGLLSPAGLQRGLAHKMGYPCVDLHRFPVERAALQALPYAQALKLQVLPLMWQGRTLVVAAPDPLQQGLVESLEFSVQRKVLAVLGVAQEWPERIRKAYRDMGPSEQPTPPVLAAEAPVASDAMQLAAELADELKGLASEENPIEQSDNTLVRLINSMITEAYQQRASDIHIEPYPGQERLVIRFRIDGQMRPYLELPAHYRSTLIARIKIMCDLDISERRKPQDGKIRFARFGGLPIELRVVTIPTVNGLEDVILRVLSSGEPLPLDRIDLSAAHLQAFCALLERPHGLFLCVGPTGSGKTTTLHSALQRLNVPSRKIWTAEDPVEITQHGLRQIQVNPRIGWTFAAALRSLLRADPDVIMVGEVRDAETAQMAVEAALTGHLVLSTLHTNSAAETVVRLIDLGVDPFAFSDSLQGILAQRLVRRWCPACVVHRPITPAALQELVSDYQSALPEGHRWHDTQALVAHWHGRFAQNGGLQTAEAAGCERCAGTGYSGRLALHELLLNTPEMRQRIQARQPAAVLQAQALRQGSVTLRQDGIDKVLQGLTGLAEVRAGSPH